MNRSRVKFNKTHKIKGNHVKSNHLNVDHAKQIALALINSIPSNLSVAAGIRWSNSADLLTRKVQKLLVDDGTREVGVMVAEWQDIYREYFGIDKDFSKLTIPQKPTNLNRLIIRASEIDDYKIIQVCENRFMTNYHPLGEFGDNFSGVFQNEPRPKIDYAFWVTDVTEAEVSPPDDVRSPPGILMTLSERLLMELKYHAENGGHLDNERVTCCFGTTHAEGHERPVVCYRKGVVQIFWQAGTLSESLISGSPYWSREMFF